jgi:hypothetical protein
MYQSLPPDGKLHDVVARKLEAGRPCKLTTTQILSESTLGTSHQSLIYRRFTETLSVVNVGHQLVVRLSGTDSHFLGQNSP